MDSINGTLQDARCQGPRANLSQAKQALAKPTTEHRERQHTPSAPKNTQFAGRTGALPTTGRSAAAQQHHDHDHDEAAAAAPLAQPTADHAPSSKPVFTRGISMYDGTAVTSSAPTPAGEISNPMSFGMGQSIPRQRESHLPDLDLLQKVRAMSTTHKAPPAEEEEEEDEFGPDLCRRVTETGR